MASAPYERGSTCACAAAPPLFRPEQKDEAEYLATSSPNLRKDMKRKMKSLARVQVEVRDRTGDVGDAVVALFQETKAKRKADYAEFGEVPDDYFRQVVENLGGRAKLLLMRIDGQLVCFNVFREEETRIIGKYIGMRYPIAPGCGDGSACSAPLGR